MSFESLGLRPEIQRAVAEQGYTEPTPIQAQAIPVVLQGRDIMPGYGLEAQVVITVNVDMGQVQTPSMSVRGAALLSGGPPVAGLHHKTGASQRVYLRSNGRTKPQSLARVPRRPPARQS